MHGRSDDQSGQKRHDNMIKLRQDDEAVSGADMDASTMDSALGQGTNPRAFRLYAVGGL
jgi:hypothetical protein